MAGREDEPAWTAASVRSPVTESTDHGPWDPAQHSGVTRRRLTDCISRAVAVRLQKLDRASGPRVGGLVIGAGTIVAYLVGRWGSGLPADREE